MLDKIFSLETSTLKEPSDELMGALTAPRSASGQSVTPDSSLRVSAVFSCVRLLSDTISALPLSLYRDLGAGNREVATAHPLQAILHDLPNEEMTAIDFRANVLVSLLLRGNSFNEVARTGAGQVGEVWPINPDKMFVDRSKRTNKLIFEVHDGDVRTLPANRMFRVTGLGTNGLIGLSPISLMRESIGLSMALEEHGARTFSNGAKPGGILEHPAKLSSDATKNLKDSWNEAYQGVGNAHKVAVLAEGMKWKQLGMTSEDSQFLESRKYQRSEIAGIFGVPPHMIADLEKATFSNIEHQSIQFVVYSLLPWLKKIEQSIFRDLLLPSERRSLRAEHSVQGLLRGDSKARSEFYKNLFGVGALSVNDIRRLERENSVEGGDTHYVNITMRKNNLYSLILKNLKQEDKVFQVENATGDEATIYLYDVIDNWFGVDSETFNKELAAITAPVINLRINSPGGDVFDAVAMHTALAQHPSKVVAHIDGLAASAATYVALAAEEVTMSSGSLFMIHQAWCICAGNSVDMRKQAELLDKVDGSIAAFYQEKTGLGEKKIMDWMADETWFTAEEASEHGFVDSVFTKGEKASNRYDLSAYSNAPKIDEEISPPKPIFNARTPLYARLTEISTA